MVSLNRALFNVLCTSSLVRSTSHQTPFASLSRGVSSTATTKMADGTEGDHGIPLEGNKKQIVQDALAVRPSAFLPWRTVG